jgi:hypothetical protein
MRRRCADLLALFLMPAMVAAGPRAREAQSGATSVPDRALLTRACVSCHNGASATAGLMLDKLDVDQVRKDAEVWEKIAKKIRAGMHPPATASRPDALALAAFADAVERALDRLDGANWAPPWAASVTDLEFASRLAAFLWRSWPDTELLDLAASGRLRNAAVLEQQTRRMLQDPRSDALLSNFFNQWLMLRNVLNLQPSPQLFPDFDENLRQGLLRETELFLRSQVREDHSIPELLTANYTFVNDRLARHYGIAHVSGNQFRRVPLPDPKRAGLLGHGSILALTSYATRTSPVVRGQWLLETLFGTPVPPPPASAPQLPDDEGVSATVRRRLEQHRRNPACASCHAAIDPLGYALENYDAIGRWRTSEGASRIDASATLVDGTALNGVVDLRKMLVARRDVFVTTAVERLMAYALGRRIAYYDMPAVRQIVRDAAASEYRWSVVLAGVVRSTPFHMRRSEQR